MKDDRNYIGYGNNDSNFYWPNKSKLALQFVLNYEEGAENSIMNGDEGSETFLSEIINAKQIIGASPEILVRLRDGEITVRPIAGTRPRGKTVKEDRFYEKDLLKDKKELSEHLMLLDLGRNDAGKVSKTNSIKVTESFIIERYSHVMHIVSNVIGKHDKRFSKFKSLLAGFPAGTVSGAPKIRAMEIIDELESTKRKVYAGGIGYFSANGEFDTCIALRTAVAKNNKFYVIRYCRKTEAY